MRLDHIVIVVDDLDLAVQDYTDLGFTVVPGGQHADGVTQNALVAFEDGSYLELLNFIEPPPSSHIFARGAERGEGMLTYALLPGDIEADVARARRHGLHMHGPNDGGRTRLDGLAIAWKTARTDDPALPFFCADVTARDLRVPYGPAQSHANRVAGISEVRVLAGDSEETTRRYAALLGQEVDKGGTAHRFSLGACTIVVAPPQNSEERDYIQAAGPGPYSLKMATSRSEPGILDSARLHGLRVGLVPAS